MTAKILPEIVGINQLMDETSLVIADTRPAKMFVREANNVDIDSAGNVSRRRGATIQLAGKGYHSLYKAERGWLMLCYMNQLGTYIPATTTFTALALMSDAYTTSFTEENGNLYAMNPSFSCMFLPGNIVPKPIGVPLPGLDVEFRVIALGDMEEGIYGVAYSIVDADGEESGLSRPVTLTLEAGQGVEGNFFTIIAGYRYRVYMTTANGETLRQALEFDADTTTKQILVPEEGQLAETFGLEQPPKGHIIRSFNSRLLIGSTDSVYFTEAFRPHLHDPRSFVPIAGIAYMIESVGEGVFIADKRGVRFYKGEDPSTWTVHEASPEPVVYNTSTVVSGSFFGGELAQFDEVAVWLTRTGYQAGLPSGEVVRLNAGQVKTPSYIQGCTTTVLADGRKQLLTPVNSNELAEASVALDSTTI